jgi:hypothetical protein
VQSGRAYVADPYSGLDIFDLKDPANPLLLGQYPVAGIISIDAEPSRAYLTVAGSGLQVLDTHDPAAPTLLGSYNTPADTYLSQLHVEGQQAYAIATFPEFEDIQVFDVSVPASPVLLGSTNVIKNISTMQVASGWVSVVTDNSWQIVDLRSPTAAVQHGRYPIIAYAKDIRIDGSRAYIAAEYGGGLQIVDASSPDSLMQLGSYAQIDASSLEMKNNLAYVTNPVSSGGLHIIDITTVTNTIQLGRYPISSRYWDVQVVGDLAYVATEKDGLKIIDVGDPANPMLRGANITPENSAHLQVEGHLAYVLDDRDLGGSDNVLYIMDVSDPGNPVILGSYLDPTRINTGKGMRVVDGMAYIATGQSLQIIDVSDPTQPVWRGSYNVPVWGVQVVGKRAYAATESGLDIIDVSDPTHLAVLGSYTGVSWRGSTIEVVGNLVYVAAGWSGLYILRVTDPASGDPTLTPTLTGTPTTTSTPTSTATPTATASNTPTSTPTPTTTATPTSTPTAEPDHPAQLTINYQTGMPGSAFTISGAYYEPNALVLISANERVVGTLPTDNDGAFTFSLTTVAAANPGDYQVIATMSQALAATSAPMRQANTQYTLDRAAPLREASEGISTITVPADVQPLTGSRTFLPLIER